MNALDALLTIAISATPVFELRGGLPFALARGFGPLWALVLSLVGNLAVIPALLWGLQGMERMLMQFAWSRRILRWVFARSRRKGRWVQRLGMVGLLLLVAVPLPGTGAWTGSIASRLLGLPNRRVLPWIAVGVLIAGGLVLAASLGLMHAFGVNASV